VGFSGLNGGFKGSLSFSNSTLSKESLQIATVCMLTTQGESFLTFVIAEHFSAFKGQTLNLGKTVNQVMLFSRVKWYAGTGRWNLIKAIKALQFE
jgi:hypothetical protein